MSRVVHGAAPFILTARLGRIEELLPLPADEGRRLCFRSRRRQKRLEGAGRTAIIGNVEPGCHSERQQKPYPDAETRMPRPGGSQEGKQAGHNRNASFAKQVIDVSVHVKKRQNQAGCQRTDKEGIPPEIPPAEQGVQQE